MVLYLIHEAFVAGFYRSPLLLWSMPAIMFLWLGRVWLLAGRNVLDDDPLWFAVRDNVSLALGASMVVAFISAWQITLQFRDVAVGSILRSFPRKRESSLI